MCGVGGQESWVLSRLSKLTFDPVGQESGCSQDLTTPSEKRLYRTHITTGHFILNAGALSWRHHQWPCLSCSYTPGGLYLPEGSKQWRCVECQNTVPI